MLADADTDAMHPSSSRSMVEAASIILCECVKAMIVLDLASCVSVAMMSASDSASRAPVASSRSRYAGSRIRALASAADTQDIMWR